MTGEIVNGLVGLVVGFLSGFFFERRATRAARAESEKFERELKKLAHSVLSVGGCPGEPDVATRDTDLVDLVRDRAGAVQDPEGRVPKASLASYFVGKGHPSDAVDDAIGELCSKGQAEVEGPWLRLR